MAPTADILVAAIGRPGFVTRGLREARRHGDRRRHQPPDAQAAVFDCFPEGSRKRALFAEKGSLLVGDVHPAVAAVAGAMTPVPGGVRPAHHCHGDAQHHHRRGAADGRPHR